MSQLLRVVSAYHALVGVENISSRTNDALHDRPKLYSTPGMACSYYGVFPTVYQFQFIIITNNRSMCKCDCELHNFTWQCRATTK